MDQRDVIIRPATVEDAAALLAIYAPYVTDTAVTFEYDVPTAEEFAGRIAHTLERYPYLIAERDGAPVGYAYAGVFHAREAYDWAVETSLYVKREERGTGVGGRLHAALKEALKAQGILNMNACISCPPPSGEDEYLTYDSIRFHEHLGYRLVGEFHRCGYKFGRWYHMVWMELHIGEHLPNQPRPKNFPDI